MTYAIVTSGLSKVYGEQTVVDNLSIHVPEGSIYGFLGPNGAGKSTTMKMLLGLVKPTDGRIVISPRGAEATAKKKVMPGRLIGSMIEGPSFYPNLSARDNLDLLCDYLDIPRSHGRCALATVGLGDITGNKPAQAFSLGMKQRLAVALALAANPPVLILDEPTNGLDPAGVVEMRRLIIDWARQRGTTVMISSHILSEIEQMADYVGIISAGRLRFEGKMSALRSEGHLELHVSDIHVTAEVMRRAGITHRVSEEKHTATLPVIPDSQVGDVVAQLVASKVAVYRVQLVRQSLEEAFLALTDPIYTSHLAQSRATSLC